MISKLKVQKRKLDKLLGYGGGTATTNTPPRIANDISGKLIERANLEDGDEALLITYRSDSEWFLLTSKRMIWLQDEELHRLAWHEIVGAQQPPTQSARIIKGELRSDEVPDLEIFEASGRKHILHLEPGDAYYIVWSSILYLCNYIRRPDPIQL